MKPKFVAAAFAILCATPAFAQTPPRPSASGPTNTTSSGKAFTPTNGQDGLRTEQAGCISRYRAAHPKDHTTAGQQSYVSACIRADVKAENSGAEGAKRQTNCIARYRAAHPALKDRSTVGQQTYVSQCLRTFQADRAPS